MLKEHIQYHRHCIDLVFLLIYDTRVSCWAIFKTLKFTLLLQGATSINIPFSRRIIDGLKLPVLIAMC